MTDKRIKVLLLEDEAAHTEAIRRALESQGDAFKLQVVVSLKKYREHVSTNPPDIALLDMVLPDGNGIDLLMAPPEANAFPMLLLTSHGNEQTAVAALQAGALDYIVKSPETFANMPRILTNALNQWSLIQKAKSAQKALQTSENNFSNSIENSPLGVRIVSEDGETLYANKAFLDIYGYDNIDEVKKVPPHDYFTPESQACFLLRREQESRGEPTQDKYEADIVRKDGTIRHLQVSRKEIYWNNKHQSQVIYNDITQRVQAEKQLEQVAQEWRTTFDSITDLISIHDKDNRILRVNKAVADMLKTTPQALIGQFCHEIMHGTKEPPAYCPNRLTLKTGKSAVIENYNPNFEVYFHESTSPIFNDKGEITGSVNVARDITQQKRIEEQLIMTDRLASIGELSSGVAHELNNPLTSVIGFSQLLMEGDAPDNIKEDLAIIYNEAQRAAVIVKNLLIFARKHAPVKQLSQVNMVIEDVLRLRAYEQKVNNIEVEYHLETNLPEIMMDHFQMQQVFLNIIVNAESAMLEAHHKGKLIIATAKSDNIVKITFTDDGPGITKENLKRIFDPFFTTKEVGKGTGLGLSICHGIVTEHSGKIYARSENGHGNCFCCRITS